MNSTILILLVFLVSLVMSQHIFVEDNEYSIGILNVLKRILDDADDGSHESSGDFDPFKYQEEQEQLEYLNYK
ncbi:unnamed protein product [Caenorhabditis bovis]|uniref:Uncharacterized protein n=1 Tax=Caenorhabditis bovis TaxID=2654633 RepID=A0A8S1EDE2_9PELO|nr:unnamed protein product [Caenorhabditis bovis]